MTTRESQNKRPYRGEFAELHRKLDRLDEAIRGNGKPGINQRLDRLEQIETRRSRFVWLVVSALVTGGASVFLQLLQLLGRTP